VNWSVENVAEAPGNKTIEQQIVYIVGRGRLRVGKGLPRRIGNVLWQEKGSNHMKGGYSDKCDQERGGTRRTSAVEEHKTHREDERNATGSKSRHLEVSYWTHDL